MPLLSDMFLQLFLVLLFSVRCREENAFVVYLSLTGKILLGNSMLAERNLKASVFSRGH